ncbi:hypothetical protein A3K86_22185 [Photobacterium jeanii]|uniref:DUF429 domain-containing protein n=1 Tax=Photobacterium jeanii TaxID=858640 RepID=A0A178K3F7_9GAMM|nr:DUF429 domain-containing protein [Photobacterium jeanii]OAN11627.1 hypothetical protein A3K86_22185 [Photobacterium jeanii]PST91148.1 DUF429 domain-containing protein [Photobacterium jeanii]
MRLLGIDLAWQGETNPSALALGRVELSAKNTPVLVLEQVMPAIIGMPKMKAYIGSLTELQGIAIDAPLIINNKAGMRDCEKALARDYSARKVACHAANQTLYPNAFSVELAEGLVQLGFDHLGSSKWQFECYPHPSIIECFALSERLLYKKGTVTDKKRGQVELASFIKQLAKSDILLFSISENYSHFLCSDHIAKLKGKAIKQNEDVLDALMCLYIAGLYAVNAEGKCYGDTAHGYIWVPQIRCI